LVAIFLVCAVTCLGETLRVTTWNLGSPTDPSAATSSTNRINEAAQALLKLHPDVILLQQVRDWQMCLLLAQALKPADYNVLVCSAFRDASGRAPSQSQVAILAKRKAYISWSEGWSVDSRVPGGYVFAAIQTGKHRIGFSSLQIEEGDWSKIGALEWNNTRNGPLGVWTARPALEMSVQQWLKAMLACKNWVTNRMDGMVAAGGFDFKLIGNDATVGMEAAGFSNPFLEASAEQSNATQIEGQFAANLRTPPGIILDHWPASCDLNLDAPYATHGSLVRAEPPRAAPISAENSSTQTVQITRTAGSVVPGALHGDDRQRTNGPLSPPGGEREKPARAQPTQILFWITGAIVVMAAVAILGWLMARRRSKVSGRKELIPLRAQSADAVRSAYVVVVAPQSATGSASSSSSLPPRVRLAAPSPRDAGYEGTTQDGALRRDAPYLEAERVSAAMRDGLLTHLSQWLKEKFVRRLIDDRAQLLEMQRVAALKTLAMDERLGRVERQIQQQNFAYEQRIVDLTRELNAAREGNRELIQAQITQVKAEMEAARARLMTEAKAEPDR
jgi:hypothetical protein